MAENTSPVIETRDATKHYGETVGLEGLDLEVFAGEVFGFLGPNGSGKSTTIRLLLDLIRPTRGEVFLFGESPRDPSVRGRIGYLPGELTLDNRMTATQILEFLDDLRPQDSPPVDPMRRAELCERMRLTAADLNRVIRSDSRGTKQKIGLISCFQHDPDLLILDEPTTGLDPLARETLFEFMREAGQAGRTVFHSSHVISEVDHTCSRVAILRGGRLVAVEKIEELRQSMARRMVVRFRGPVPTAELAVPGVEIIEQNHHQVVLRVDGELDPLLAVLARHSVGYMAFPEPELEDAFRQHYTGTGEEV